MIAILLALLAVVNSPYNPPTYACDGVTATFTVNFPYRDRTDLVLTSSTAGVLVLTTDYTVSLISSTTTASVTLTNPAVKCPSGTLKITRVTTPPQKYAFGQQTSFNTQTLEISEDALAYQIQETAYVAGAGVSTPGTVVANAPLTGNGSVSSHLQIPKADASTDGYLFKTDWTAFNQIVTFLAAGTGAIGRPLQSKLRDIVSVKDFGADCGGTVDDTTPLTNAITAVTTTLDITGCTLNTTGVVISHPMALVSRDPSGTIKARAGSTISPLTVSTTHDVILQGFTVDAAAAASSNQDAITVTGSYSVSVGGLTVTNAKRDGIAILNSTDTAQGRETWVSGNKVISAGRDGVHYATSGNLNIIDNMIYAASNSCVQNGGASAFDSKQINISRNVLNGCGGSGVYLTGILNGGFLDPAAPYSEHVTIADNKILNIGVYGLQINAQHVSISGNTLRDNGNYTTSTNFINQGIVIQSRYVTVSNNVIQRQGGAGIDIGYSSYFVVTGNIIHDVLGIGIEINSSRYGTVSGNDVSLACGSSAGGFVNYLRDGIGVHGDVASAIQNSTDQVVVTGNHVAPNGTSQKYGIYVSTQGGASETTNVYVYGNYTKGAGNAEDFHIDSGTNLQGADLNAGLSTLGSNANGAVHLQAYTSAGQSIPNGAGATVVFGTVDEDSASAYSSGTGVFTVPVARAGTYSIESCFAYANAQTGSVTASLRVNGSNNRTFTSVNPAANQSVCISGLYKLAALDTLSIWTTQPAGSGQSLNTNAVNNFLYVMRMP